jgi:hypothetical protein
MPYATLEVRWFFDGSLAEAAPEVESRFGADRTQESEGNRRALSWPATWRKDLYLILPGAEDMGVKLREGRLEIKGRVDTFGSERFADRVPGVTERWMKWSHAIGTRPDDAMSVVLVEKQRILRRVSLAGGTLVEIPSGQSTPDPAVDFELTRIRFAGSPTETHWSIAFEAFPCGPDLHGVFKRTVDDLLGEWPLEVLSAESSMSYPAWLSQLVTD